MNIFIIILTIVGFKKSFSLNCYKPCILIDKNNTNIIKCFIDKMEQVNLSCLNFKTTEIHLIPNTNIILDQTLNLNIEDLNTDDYLDIVFSHLDGFNLNNDFKFTTKQKNKQGINIIIYNSKFVFYIERDNFLTDSQCNEYFLSKIFSKFFNIKSHLILSRMNYNYQKTCPMVFKNASVQYLHFNYMCNSLVEKNFIQFLNINATNLNAKIYSLSLSNFYRVNLDENVLSNNVFSSLVEFKMSGTIQKIQTNLFETFKSLRRISLNIFNFEEFINFGLEWMLHVKSNQTISSDVAVTFDIYDSELFKEYHFPEEDICLFKDIYKNKIINFSLIGFRAKTSLSCTFLWIFRKLSLDGVMLYESLEFRDITNECKFDFRIEGCNQMNLTNSKNFYFKNINDVKYFVYEMKFIVIIIILPLISLAGIILNLLVIVVIVDKRHNHTFHRNIYKFMCGISVFNLMILILSLLKLMSECTTFNGIFCSKIRENLLIQSFYITQAFLNRFLKFCANLSLIFFSLSRYLNVKQENKSYLIKRSPFSLVKIYFCMFLFGFLLSFENFLQYKLNNGDWNYYNKFPIEKNLFIDFENINEGLIYLILSLISEFLNSFIMIVLNLILDIVLIFKFKRLKRNFCNLFEKSKSSYFKRLKQKEINLFKMVILTGILNFTFRLPELIGSIFKYLKYFLALQSFKYKLSDKINLFVDLCVHLDICTELQDMSEIFYLASCSVDFFVFYIYNKSFRVALKKLLRIK